MDSELSSRQERRAARRKMQILEAAATVFAEKGFHRATTKEIAEAADVAEGTIYNYFESKDDLLISLIDWLSDLQGRREIYDETLDADVRQSFYHLMFQRLTAVQAQNVFFFAVLPEILSTPHLRELYRQRVMVPAMRDLEEHFQARVERNQIGAVDVPIVVRVLGALGLGLEIMRLLGDKEVQDLWDDPARLTTLVTQAVFDGLLPKPADHPESSG